LIAASHSIEQIRDFIGLDSLNYLSIEGLLEAAGATVDDHPFCLACFDGNYPIRFADDVRKDCFEEKRK
jgi:amidophosphoribosyltransferase